MLNGDNLFEIINIGASKLEPTYNAVTVQGKGPASSDDPNDAEDFSDTPLFGSLGIIGRPFPQTDAGKAQGLLIRNGGRGAVVGMRDNRTNDVYGNLEAGDTCVFSTGPRHAARIVLKEGTSSVVIMGKDSTGKDMMISIDGENDALSVQAKGCILQFTDQGIVLGFKKNQIVINESGITIGGAQVVLGSGVPTFAVVGAIPIASGAPVLCGPILSTPLISGTPTFPPTAPSGSVFLTT